MATCPSCGSPASETHTFCALCGAPIRAPRPAGTLAPPDVAVAAPVLPGHEAPPDEAASTPAPDLAQANVALRAADAGLASVGDRMLAVVLDTLVFFAFFWTAGMWLAPHFGGVTPQGFSLEGMPALVTIALSIVPFFVYYVCLEWWFATTLGKVVVGARIVGADGGGMDFRRSLIRNLFRLIDGLGVYVVAAFALLLTKRRQRLGDLAAGTVVVRHDYPALVRAAVLLVLLVVPVATVVGAWWLWGRQAQGTTTTVNTTTATGSTSSTGQGTAAGGSGASSSSGGGPLGDVSDGPFLVTGLRLAAGEHGPDRPNAVFKPGEAPTLLFQITGFATQGAQGGRVRLSIQGRDGEGVPLNEPTVREFAAPANAASLRSWANLTLPEYVVAGAYRLEVTLEDLVGSHKVLISTPFSVEGRPFRPSPTLALRELRLTEGEDGPARGDAVFGVGGTVWMAFEVVGFKAGADKRVHVQEHMIVTSSSGARLIDGDVLDLNDVFFYVPKRLPMANHISLAQMPPGDYAATLSMTDVEGGQRCEETIRFTIR
jgi:uncharacterized RDD family membrane protein YckC